MDNLHEAPLGTITAWVTRPSADGEVASLPAGWQRCDGTTIAAPSIWEDKTTPNLNGERRFLRGGSDEDMLRLEEDQLQQHRHKLVDPGHSHGFVDIYTDDDNGHHNGAKNGEGQFDARHNSETSKQNTGAYKGS